MNIKPDLLSQPRPILATSRPLASAWRKNDFVKSFIGRFVFARGSAQPKLLVPGLQKMLDGTAQWTRSAQFPTRYG